MKSGRNVIILCEHVEWKRGWHCDWLKIKNNLDEVKVMDGKLQLNNFYRRKFDSFADYSTSNGHFLCVWLRSISFFVAPLCLSVCPVHVLFYLWTSHLTSAHTHNCLSEHSESKEIFYSNRSLSFNFDASSKMRKHRTECPACPHVSRISLTLTQIWTLENFIDKRKIYKFVRIWENWGNLEKGNCVCSSWRERVEK
jgi:hypothetical protein